MDGSLSADIYPAAMTDAAVVPGLLNQIRRKGVLYRRGRGTAQEFCFVSGHWRCFYAGKGNQAPKDAADTNDDGVPDHVKRVLCGLELGYRLLCDGFRLPEPVRDGVRFVDIRFDDMPSPGGMTAARPQTTAHAILDGTPHQGGQALEISLHRALASGSATPQREVFRLFQYGLAPFRSGWFSEGLAIWFSLQFENQPAQQEPLPATRDGLSALLLRKQGAEAFWSRLFRLCDPAEPDGRRFLKHLLDFLAARRDQAVPEKAAKNLLPKELPGNNLLILRGILDAMASLAVVDDAELLRFAGLLRDITGPAGSPWRAQPVQRLLQDLRRHGASGLVAEQDGLLYSPHFDPLTGTLALDTLQLRTPPPESFAAIRRLHGDLRIAPRDMADFHALDSLEEITGTLTISDNPALVSLSGLSALSEVGSLVIENNPLLETLAALPALRRVDKRLRLARCPRLRAIAGLSTLDGIGGPLEIEELGALTSLGFLGSLTAAGSVLIKSCPIDSAEPLRRLIEAHPEFPGSIRISGTRIGEVGFLATLRRTGSSLNLSENRITSIAGLAGLESVGASLSLADNRLADLTPLRRLRAVDGVLSVSRNALASLAGLETLRRLRTKTWGDSPSTLRLYGNPALRDVSALANLEADGHRLVVHLDRAQRFDRLPAADSPFHRNHLEVRDFATKAPVDGAIFLRRADVPESDADTLCVLFADGAEEAIRQVVDGVRAHRVDVGQSVDLAGAVEVLKRLIGARPYRQTLCLGVGAGGALAIKAGWAAGMDHVLAFAPSPLPPEDLVSEQPNRRPRLWLYHPGDGPADGVRLPTPAVLRSGPYDILDRLRSEGCPAEQAMAAEVFLALTQVLEDPYELVEGAACPAPAASPPRMAACLNVGAWLFNHFRHKRFRIHAGQDFLRVTNPAAILAPDIFVTRADQPADSPRTFDDAEAVVEVIDGPMMAFDKGRRFDLLTRLPSLREIAVIDVSASQARVLRRAPRGWGPPGWRGEDLPPGGDLRLDSLGVTIPAAVVFPHA